MHRPAKSRRRRSRRGRRSSHVKPSKDFFFNEESVMVYHDEAGHTDGDSIVLFQKSAVLVAGGHIDSPERLSRREIETLRLMGGGHINREIADAFGTTEGTVKNHVSNILLKLGVKSRTQAVLTGMELGYLGSQRRS